MSKSTIFPCVSANIFYYSSSVLTVRCCKEFEEQEIFASSVFDSRIVWSGRCLDRFF
jgi:hypothetical protein